MGAPIINISFIDKARTALSRAERSIVGLVLKDTIPTVGDKFVVVYEDDIPSGLSDFNKAQIKLALKGNVSAPLKVECFVMDEDASDISDEYTKAKEWIQNTKIHFLAIPTVKTDNQLSAMKTYIKNLIDTKVKKIFFISPFDTTGSDHESIIDCDFTGYNEKEDTYTATNHEYTAEEYCARIAGFIAGTPFTQSITYGVLTDLTGCNLLSRSEQDAAVDAGKVVLEYDGEKVKIVRGVTSLTTLTTTKKKSFKKIKIVNIMNLIYDDLVTTIKDSYIGKFNNTYNDKDNLAKSIIQYFKSLVMQSIIEDGTCSVDFDAQRNWLKGVGENVASMSDSEILKADTESNVFLLGKVQIPDAMEDIELPIYL